MIHRFRGLLGVLAAMALAGPAQADLLSRSAYDSAIATNLPDNTAGAISEQDIRDAYTDLADSVAWQGEVEHRVINMSTTTPPGSPTAGDSYVVGPSATGAWAGQDGKIAIYDGDAAAWVFFAPVDGLAVWNQADDTQYRWDAAAGPAAWAAQGTSGSVAIEDEGASVNSATTLDFVGAGVSVADAGGGEATVTIPGGATFAGAKMTKSAGQSVSNATETAITWDGEDFDTANGHDNATNNHLFSVPSGWSKASVVAVVRFNNGTAGKRQLVLKKTGTSTFVSTQEATGTIWVTLATGPFSVTGGTDTLAVYADQVSGGSLTIGSTLSYFTVTRVE